MINYRVFELTAAAFIISCGFSWVSFGLTGLDSQPWPALAAMLFLMLALDRGVKGLFLLPLVFPLAAMLVGFGFVVLGFGQVDFLLLRAIFSYLTFAVVFSAYCVCVERVFDEVRKRRLVIANDARLVAAGVLQLVFGSSVLEAIIATCTSAGRGVIGLSPEPTYHGIHFLALPAGKQLPSDATPEGPECHKPPVHRRRLYGHPGGFADGQGFLSAMSDPFAVVKGGQH